MHQAFSSIFTLATATALVTAVTASCAVPDSIAISVEADEPQGARGDDTSTVALPRTRCFVATTGDDDTATGTPGRPYATVNAALAVPSCTTILLKPGTYAQRVMVRRQGTPRRPIVITTAGPAHSAVIDGGAAGAILGVDVQASRQATVTFEDAAYIELRDLQITHDARQYCTATPVSTSFCHAAGILVRNRAVLGDVMDGASSHHITLTNNDIHDVIAASLVVNGSRPFDAIPVAIYSDRDGVAASGDIDDSEATHHIELRSNTIRDSDPNSDANTVYAITVSRNVTDVLIEANTVTNITPSSVVQPSAAAIGVRGERATGDFVTSTHARPRGVVVRENTIDGVAGTGVFIQSARGVLVERNSIHRASIGVQIVTEGAEAHGLPAGRAKHVWVRDNYITDVTDWGIDMGMLSQTGYSPVEDVFVSNNTLLVNRDALPINNGRVYDRFPVVLREGVLGDSAFVNNIIDVDWTVPSPSDRLLFYVTQVPDTSFENMTRVDHNLWFARGSAPPALFCKYNAAAWTRACVDFGEYQDVADASGLFADPLVIDGRLLASSPAIDAGTSARPGWVHNTTFGAYGSASCALESDFYGSERADGAVDIGMEEYVSQ